MSLKVSVSGVRGIVGWSLTPTIIEDFAKAFGSYAKGLFFKKRAKKKSRGLPTQPLRAGPAFAHKSWAGAGPTLLVGRDTRLTGEKVKAKVLSGLLSTGCRVVDLGVCPTPTLLFMARKLKCDGGIVITASHNPEEWNGLKFVCPDGTFLSSTQTKKLYSIYDEKKFVQVFPLPFPSPQRGEGIPLIAPSSQRGEGYGVEGFHPRQVKVDNRAIRFHIEKVLQTLDTEIIKRRKFKVAMDYCNGTGALITPLLLKRLGCKVVAINEKPLGVFAHDPEPTPENLKSLSRLAKDSGADIGFAQDPDADRLAIVSEKSKPLGEENTLALAVKYILQKTEGPSPQPSPQRGKGIPLIAPSPQRGEGKGERKKVVVNLSTSRMIDDIASEFGATVIRSAVGEANVVKTMKETGALIGGEGNGGVIYPKINFCRDSLVGIGLILQYMAESQKRISELAGSIPRYHMVKTKVAYPLEKAPSFLRKVEVRFKKRKLELLDGVRVNWKDCWVHIRPSNTEPVIRIISEARTEQRARQLCNMILKLME